MVGFAIREGLSDYELHNWIATGDPGIPKGMVDDTGFMGSGPRKRKP